MDLLWYSRFRGRFLGLDPPEGARDIAWQLVNNEPGKRFRVVMGGGYPAFFPLEMAQELRERVLFP